MGIVSRTVHASVVRLDVRFLHFPILRDQGVALGPIIAEDGGGVEGQVEFLGEFAGGVA